MSKWRACSMLVAACLLATTAQADDKARKAYEGAVAELYGYTTAIPITVQWCREKRPDIRQSLDGAEKKWREMYGDLMADLERRLQDIINISDELPASARAGALPMIRQASTEMARKKMADMPEEKAMASCMLLPAMIDGPTFAVESHYADELALIRAWPGVPPIPGSPRN